MRRVFFASVAILSSGCASLLGLDDFTEAESGSGGAPGTSSSEGVGNPTSSSAQGGGQGGQGTPSSSGSSVGSNGSGGTGAGNGTGGDTGSGGSAPLDVSPEGNIKVGILRSLQFTSNVPTTWEVQEADGGSIDADGRYLSPDVPGTFHVVATAVDDPSDTVTVNVTAVPLGIRVFGGIPGGPGTTDGDIDEARVIDIGGMAVVSNSDQELVFSDSSMETIRAYNRPDGEVRTIAGSLFESGTVDGTGTAARFDNPGPVVAAETGGRVFVADVGNFCIRDVNVATGAVTTLAGSCGTSQTLDANTGGASRFERIESMVRAPDNAHLYVCQSGSTYALRRVEIATGRTETIPNISIANSCRLGTDFFNAKIYVVTGSGDRMIKSVDDDDPFAGTAVTNLVEMPADLSFADGFDVDTGFGGANDVYLTYDSSMWRYRLSEDAFDAEPMIGPDYGYVDGPIEGAKITYARVVRSHSPQGQLYFADQAGYTIRRVQTGDDVETLFGVLANLAPIDGSKSVARMMAPFAAAFDEDGNAYVTSLGEDLDNVIRRVDGMTGAISTFSGVRGFDGDFIDGPADVARLGLLFDIVRVGDFLYVLDGATNTLRRISLADGAVDTVAGELGEVGNSDGIGAQARFNFEEGAGLATDGTDLYLADGGNFAIRKIELATAEVTTIAGGVQGSEDGVGLAAQFVAPVGLTFDRDMLFVVDIADHTVRRMDLSTTEVTTFLGIAGSAGEDDGGVGVGTFDSPFRLAADGIGNLYVTGIREGEGGATIRRVSLEDATVSAFAGDALQRGLRTRPLPSTLGCAAGLVVDASGDLIFCDRCDGALGIIRPL